MNTINTKVQQLQQQKEALDARIAKLEELENSTTPVKNLLVSLLADYATEALEELPIIWEEILAIGQQHGLSVQPLAADELREWEADRAELEKLRLEVKILRFAIAQVQPDNEPEVWHKEEIAPELESLYQEALVENTEADSEATLTDEEYEAAVEEELVLAGDGTTAIYEEVFADSPEPEYEPEETSDTVESVLKAKGFFQPNDLEDYDSSEKYETYRGWDIYYSLPNGGIVAIGLYDAANNQPWDASTEYIQEVDPTFPESLADFDEIVKWTQALIDQVVPGQLSLKFLDPIAAPEQNPYKKSEDEFVEFVKISNAVGYLKRRDNGQLIAGYMAFSNKLPDGHRAGTQAKSRAAKWAEWLKGIFGLECDAPRIVKQIISDNSKQPFAYEVKLKGLSIGQLTKLAEEDFSLLPGGVEEQQQNTELLRSETKASPTSPGEIEQATEPRNDGLTDEQYSKAVEEELALDDDDSSELATPPVKFTGLALGPECGLNEDELELVEMAKAAILECDSEMVKNVNSVFKEVCEKNAANRVKVWNALTEKEQQTYKLLLQMEFVKAPDFAEQTPEYIVTIDGDKSITNVWISLREVDGKLARVWRYKGQKDEIGYTTKEAAAIAAISQQAG